MKRTNLLYWIFTILFALLMLLSAIPDIIMSPEAVTIMTALGYPRYFIPFIGVAKTLGVIAILIPGFPRIKEWAYAGLFFDLIGAIYSGVATGGFDPKMLFLLLWIVPGILSYYFYHKKKKSIVYRTKIIMVEIFKTNLYEEEQCEWMTRQLTLHLPGSKINFDLQDRDKILRVEADDLSALQIISIMNDHGFYAESLI